MKKIAAVLLGAAFVFQLTACSHQPYVPTYSGVGNKQGVSHYKKNSQPCPCNKSKKKK